MITLQDVAEKSGVSATTVSYVLNGRESKVGISAKTKERVLVTAREMGYNPAQQLAARRMAGRKHGTAVLNRLFCLFFPPNFQQSHYFARVFDGMQRELEAQNYDLITSYGGSRHDQRLPHALIRGEVDGVLLTTFQEQHDWLIPYLRSQTQFGERPIVAMLHPFADCDSVVADEEDGAYQVARHLLELGHRKILHFYGTGGASFHVRSRLMGYHRACRDLEVKASSTLVGIKHLEPQSGQERAGMKQMVGEALSTQAGITAVLARNDSEVADVVAALETLNYRVPETMSVAGFDDACELRNQSGVNILTTVRLPLEEIGRRAAQRMIERVTGDKGTLKTESTRPAPLKEVLSVELVARGSTAVPRSS